MSSVSVALSTSFSFLIHRNEVHTEGMGLKVLQALHLGGGVAGNGTARPTVYEKLVMGATLRSPPEPLNKKNGRRRNESQNPNAAAAGVAASAGIRGDVNVNAGGGGDEGFQMRRHRQMLHRQTQKLEQQEREQVDRQREKDRRLEELVKARDEIWSRRRSAPAAAVAAGLDSDDKSSADRAVPQADAEEGDKERGGEAKGGGRRERGRTAGSGHEAAAASPQSRVELVQTAPAVFFSSSSLSSSSSAFSLSNDDDDDDDEYDKSGGGGGDGGGRAAAAVEAISKKGSAETLLGRWSGVGGGSERFSEVHVWVRSYSAAVRLTGREVSSSLRTR